MGASNSAISHAWALLETGVSEAMDGDQWSAVLRFQRAFTDYSFLNTWLIMTQDPGATRVAGYRTWQKLGRQVRKGEKAIAIVAPIISKSKIEEDAREVRFYRRVSVFDVRQTDGEPLPSAPEPKVLTASDDTIRDHCERLERLCEEESIGVSNRKLPGTMLGAYIPGRRDIVLAPHLPPLQTLKTLLHEVAHAVMEHEHVDRQVAELEAESCAYMVCHALGYNTSSYSFPYLATWAPKLADLVNAGARARQAATQLLRRLQIPSRVEKTGSDHLRTRDGEASIVGSTH